MRATALVVLAVYLLFVTWLALRPLPVLWVPPANAEPFASIRDDLAKGPERAVQTIGGGLLRLAPLGALLPLLGRGLGGSRFASLVRTTFAGAMVSLALELSQTQVPSRVADIDSVILNACGIALTHLLCYGPLRSLALQPARRAVARQRLGRGPRQEGQNPLTSEESPPRAPREGCVPKREGAVSETAKALDGTAPAR